MKRSQEWWRYGIHIWIIEIKRKQWEGVDNKDEEKSRMMRYGIHIWRIEIKRKQWEERIKSEINRIQDERGYKRDRV